MRPIQQVAIIVIRDESGSFFLHQRRSDKSVFPDRWGCGAGGKIDVGESAGDAAQRELLEETGCTVSVQWLFDQRYEAADGKFHMHIFEIVTDRSTVGFDESEWQATQWCTEDELRVHSTNDSTMCPDTAAFLHTYFRRCDTGRCSHDRHTNSQVRPSFPTR